MRKRLVGVIAAIPTPIDTNGDPDVESFVNLARFLLENCCDGLNVLGTTGEATSFSVAQRIGLMTSVAARLPVDKMMVGAGAAAVADAVEIAKAAGELGFGGALILPPFYYKGVSDAGILRYFREIIGATAATEIPIYLYNFPALSGVLYSPDIVDLLIAEFGERIAGLKDSSGDMAYARDLATRDGFDVFPSNEAALIEAHKGGFAGCISATANVNARFCAAAFHQGDEGAVAVASKIRGLFTGYSLVPAVKSVVAHMQGVAEYGAVKPPLVALDDGEAAALCAAYDAASG